jgi:hypothetical protein
MKRKYGGAGHPRRRGGALRLADQRAVEIQASAVKLFLQSLKSAGQLVFLPFIPASTDYTVAQCHANCEAEQRRTGAMIVCGWMIWEIKRASFIEAEFHAVVRRDGNLIDITPRRDKEKLILFAPDSERIAVRINERSWQTWSNHVQHGINVQPTRVILTLDPNGSNVWPDSPNLKPPRGTATE